MTAHFCAGAVSRLDGGQYDGIHLLWTPPARAGYSLDGFDIQRRLAREVGKPDCVTLSQEELAQLHAQFRLETAIASLALRNARWPESVKPSICLTYTIDFRDTMRDVEVGTDIPFFGIGFLRGKAVAAVASTTRARFISRIVDRVMLYTRAQVGELLICHFSLPKADDEAAEWATEPYLARNLQLPVRAADPALASTGEELRLAQSRLLGAERVDAFAFSEVAQTLNGCIDALPGTSPVYTTLLSRSTPKNPFADVRAWPLALAVSVMPEWRSMLGLGFRDDAGLRPDASYDYRVTGRFHRRDLAETFYGFHTVPVGTLLPTSFHLGPFLLRTPKPAIVALATQPPDNALRHTSRKGIAIGSRANDVVTLEVSFASPVRSVVLELDARGGSLSYQASRRFGTARVGGSASVDAVVELTFAEAVDELTIAGDSLFLFGIDSSRGSDVVSSSIVLQGIRFEPTPPPAAPLSVRVTNLQEPILPGDPRETSRRAPNDLGFRIAWLPAPGLPWPPDLDATPPQDAIGFRVERCRVDLATDFEPVGDPGMLVFGSRPHRREPPPLVPGIDLLEAFPESRPSSGTPVTPFLEAEDVIVSADGDGPPPGSFHQYRVTAIDAIGRRSPPTVGEVVRLEKHRRPPSPVGPPPWQPPSAPAAGIKPGGVRARILQAGDAVGDDRALLGDARNAIVVEWGWRPEERALDRFVREFRVYLNLDPPDRVRGDLLPPIRRDGAQFVLRARLSRAVVANQMAGTFVRAGESPFRISRHEAGRDIDVWLDASRVDPSRVPEPGDFVFLPQLEGEEQTPIGWERMLVQPVGDPVSLRAVFRDLLTIDADHPNVRIWAGVTAADREDYVEDVLPPSKRHGGRNGNESRIAIAEALARYRGRPEFLVPPRVADVPELLTREPAAGTADVTLDLAALLPTITIAEPNRLRIERFCVDGLIARLSIDGGLAIHLPDTPAPTPCALANADDTAQLVAAIRTGMPGRVPSRYLMRIAIDYEAALESLWEATPHEAVPHGVISDRLLDKPTRYLYRGRLVDGARHVSRASAIAPVVVRVPSMRSPAPPEFRVSPHTRPGGVVARVRYTDVFDLSWIVFFRAGRERAAPSLDRAQLLRVPNLQGRYPRDGLGLRLADGRVLAPAQIVEITPGTVEGQQRALDEAVIDAPGDHRIAVWAVAVTRDGVPSRLAGPQITDTPPAPPLAPALSLDPSPVLPDDPAAWDRLRWTALSADCEAALQCAPHGTAEWSRVSPWLGANVQQFATEPRGGARDYQLITRDTAGQTAASNIVTIR
jgi:hypothetical protein